MTELIIIWLFFVLWFLLGCLVLSAIDDDNNTLYRWASNCPIPLGYELTVLAWPVVLYFWWKVKKENS